MKSIQSEIADSSLGRTTTHVTDNINKKVKHSFFKSKKRAVRYGLLIANITLVFAVALFIVSSRDSGTNAQAPVLNLVADEEVSDPLDTLSGADIALNVALMSGLTEASSVVHNVDAESIKKTIVPSGSQSISKPQILRTELKSKNDITEHVVQEGDTLESIAIKYGVNSRSISWSNSNVTTSQLNVGDALQIPPVDGIVHVVKPGDTPSSLAADYRSDEARIVAFNDAEIGGLVEGDKIIIPDGQIVQTSRNNGSYLYNFTAAYGGNAYAPGNCTWHTANRRAAVGKPVPSNLGNAATWVARASAAGIATGNVPQQYAAVQTARSGWGHVGFVEEVYEDGSILMSEMNYNWNLYALRNRVVPAAEAATYRYVY